MVKVLAGFPDFYQHPTIVSLGGQEYTIRYTWRDRPNSWYMDILTIEGEPILMGRRLQPGIPPDLNARIEALPGGKFMVIGPDCYTIEDLASSLLAMWLSSDEIVPAAATQRYTIVSGDVSLPMVVV